MTTVSDADTWWTAPGGGMPMTGFAAATDFADWFYIGALAAGLPARISVLPDYFIPYGNGVPVGGLLPETLIAAGNIRLYQRVTITGNFDNGATSEGLYSDAASSRHDNQLIVPVGSAIELTDQILTEQFSAGIFPYTFYQVTVEVPPTRTVVYNDPEHPANSYTVTWENAFYLEVAVSSVLPGAPPGTAGRYLVTTGNPTGQRNAQWGEWVDGWDIVTLQPVGAPMFPSGTDLDPQNLPSIIDFYATADHHGVETPSIASSLDASWWRANGETVLGGYAAMALDALKQLADAAGRPNLGAAIDVVNASAGAASVWSFLDGLVANIWAHTAEGISLAALAGASPNPSALSSQIADWEARGEQIMQEAQQQANDQSLSIVLDKIVAGAGTVWSVFQSVPYGAHEKNSFSLSVQVPGLPIEGSDKSDVLFGGGEADEMHLGGGTDFALGFEGNDVIFGGAGNDWLQGGADDDALDGGTGIDTALFSGNRSASAIARTDAGYSVSGPEGADTLTAIERLQFADKKVALDLGTGQAAGNTVRIIGAAFDAPFIIPQFVSIGLNLFDNTEMSVVEVCELAIGTGLFQSLAGSSGNEAFVNLVFQNVVGVAPTEAQRANFVGMLQGSGGSMTQAQLLELAANVPLNAVNINLVGLQDSGVEFV